MVLVVGVSVVLVVGVIVALVVGVSVVLVVGVIVVLVVGVIVVLVIGVVSFTDVVLEGCVVVIDDESVEDGAADETVVVDEVLPHSGRCCCLPVRHALISRSDTVDCVTLA